MKYESVESKCKQEDRPSNRHVFQNSFIPQVHLLFARKNILNFLSKILDKIQNVKYIIHSDISKKCPRV